MVTALNASDESSQSCETAVTPTASVLPAPVNVKAIAGNGQASLVWDDVTSELVYNLYRSTTPGGPYTLLAPEAPGPSFTDTGLTNGTRYYYVVQTLSTDGGAYSDEVSVTPTSQLPPAPTALVATPGSTWARLTWKASAGASRSISIKLDGGLESDFSTVNDNSTIDGALKVRSGKVTMKRVKIP